MFNEALYIITVIISIFAYIFAIIRCKLTKQLSTILLIAPFVVIFIFIIIYKVTSVYEKKSSFEDNLPKINMQYDINSTDGLPYGFMYSGTKGYIQKIIALPYAIEQMHTSLDLYNTKITDVPKKIDISNIPKASYSIVISTGEKYSISIENITLIIDSYEKLPNRYISTWNRKGFIKRVNKNIFLSSSKQKYIIFSGNNSIYHLSPHESFPIRLNILGADPGLYEFHIELKGVINGKNYVIKSEKDKIAAPDPKNVENSINVIYKGIEDELFINLLELSPNSFKNICLQYSNKFPNEEEIRKLLKKKL